MIRRELLKGLLALPFLPLAKLIAPPAAQLQSAWVLGGTGDPPPFIRFTGTTQQCCVWNHELTQLEIWNLHRHANKHPLGCICNEARR